MLPAMRRPPGPRNARATADTLPNVTRVPPPEVAAAPKTSVPTMAPAPSAHSRAVPEPVSTLTTARSPSKSTPATVPRVERPSAKVTVTSSPRMLWALVRTRPSPMTTPDPRWVEPIPTIDAPAWSATAVRADWSSSMADMRLGSPIWLLSVGERAVDLRLASYYRPASLTSPGLATMHAMQSRESELPTALELALE